MFRVRDHGRDSPSMIALPWWTLTAKPRDEWFEDVSHWMGAHSTTGVETYQPFLQKESPIRHIGVSYRRPTSVTSDADARELELEIRGRTSDITLSIARCSLTTEQSLVITNAIFYNMRHVVSIDLSSNSIGFHGHLRLVEMIGVPTNSLRHLSLRLTDLSIELIQLLFHTLAKDSCVLQTLDIAYNRCVTDTDMSIICDDLAENTSLTTLNMSNMGMYSQGYGVLLKTMSKHPRIRFLTLGDILTHWSIGQNQTVQALQEFVRKNLSCVCLTLQGFTMGNDCMTRLLSTMLSTPRRRPLIIEDYDGNATSRFCFRVACASLPTPILAKNNRMLANMMRETWYALLLSFSMGSHLRLGERSPVLVLDEIVMIEICEQFWNS